MSRSKVYWVKNILQNRSLNNKNANFFLKDRFFKGTRERDLDEQQQEEKTLACQAIVKSRLLKLSKGEFRDTGFNSKNTLFDNKTIPKQNHLNYMTIKMIGILSLQHFKYLAIELFDN
jgi:hypothetical protein